MVRLVALALGAAGCLESGVTHCDDGGICAVGLVCNVGGGCVSATPCLGHADGDDCTGVGVSGRCRGGVCHDERCGNGVIDPPEECDDGGLLSHDGCSSGCLREIPTWTQALSGVPTPRTAAAMVYERERGRIVLFGGHANATLMGDTWEWDGVDWTEPQLAISPSPRYGHAMAYDAARGRIVMFGGDGGSLITDGVVWEWDGTAWTSQTSATSPAARYGHAMAYDAARGRVVLFGGATLAGFTNDTWEWDGTVWQLASPAVSPPPREGQVMVYDPVRQVVVMFGGADSVADRNDTWEWDGTTWSDHTPASSPPGREGQAMAFDAARGTIVMFGGIGTGDLGDTWEWDGELWAQQATPTAPAPRGSPAFAYDSARATFVIFGGADATMLYSDTWIHRYSSTTLDETCTAAVDTDGDGLVGCADPDCWGYCTPSCPPGTTCDPMAPHCGDGICNPDLESTVCTADCP